MVHRRLIALIFLLNLPMSAVAADSLQERVLEELGGRATLEEVEAVRLQYEVRMFGLDGRLEQWFARGGRAHSHLELGGLFEVRTVLDGDRGWFRDQNGKVSALSGEDLALEVTSAWLGDWTWLLEPGAVQELGLDPESGLATLLGTPDGGVEVRILVDPETGLPGRTELPVGDRVQTSTFEDWEEFGGIRFPGRTVQSRGDPQYDASFVLVSAELDPAIDPGLFSEPEEAATAVHFSDGAPVRDIPLEFNTVHVFLQASVNGSDPLWFLLDTGASITVLSSETALELGLRLEGKIEGRGAGEGSVEVNLVPDVAISLPGVRLDGQTVACLPVADIEARLGRTLDGILGYDFISRFVVEIDYPGHTLALHDRNDFDYAGDGVVVPILIEGGTPQASARIAPHGREPVESPFLVDTGASGTIHFARPFAESVDLAASFPRSFVFSGGYGVGGETSSTIGRIDWLELGGLRFRAPFCAVAHDEGGALAHPGTGGLIGGVILERCTVYFDYERERMILEPGEDFDRPFETDWSGLVVRTGGRGDFGRLTVARVIEGSVAEAAGVREGDVVRSADGVSGEALTKHALWKMCLSPGRTVELELDRAGEILTARLELESRI